MSDDFETRYAQHKGLCAKVNELNKTVLFDALAPAGITFINVDFDGEGDSGQIEAVTACAGDVDVTLPTTPVTLHETSWDRKALITVERSLLEAIETLCYGYLEHRQGGWENNDGAFGSFAFDVAKRAIELEFNGRFTDVATHNYDL